MPISEEVVASRLRWYRRIVVAGGRKEAKLKQYVNSMSSQNSSITYKAAETPDVTRTKRFCRIIIDTRTKKRKTEHKPSQLTSQNQGSLAYQDVCSDMSTRRPKFKKHC